MPPRNPSSSSRLLGHALNWSRAIGVCESRVNASLLPIACQGGTRSPRRIPQSTRDAAVLAQPSPPKVPWRRSACLAGRSHFRQDLDPLGLPGRPHLRSSSPRNPLHATASLPDCHNRQRVAERGTARKELSGQFSRCPIFNRVLHHRTRASRRGVRPLDGIPRGITALRRAPACPGVPESRRVPPRARRDGGPVLPQPPVQLRHGHRWHMFTQTTQSRPLHREPPSKADRDGFGRDGLTARQFSAEVRVRRAHTSPLRSQIPQIPETDHRTLACYTWNLVSAHHGMAQQQRS